MRSLLLVSAVVFSMMPAHAQLGAARRAAERVASGAEQRQRRINPDNPAPDPGVAPASRPPARGNPPPIQPARPVDPAKAAAEKEVVRQRVVASQKERAEAGSAVAQYDLGIRYLTGEGVDPNPKTGRDWLKKSADQGNPDAAKKLKELASNKPEAGKP